MKLRNDVDLLLKDKIMYLKIGNKIYEIFNTDSKFLKYFDLMKNNNFENLQKDDEDFNNFKQFLYDRGAFLLADKWDSIFLQYNIKFDNFSEILSGKKLLVKGDKDLVEFFKKNFDYMYQITEDINSYFDYAVVIIRKNKRKKILELNKDLLKKDKVIFPILLDELNTFIGPLIIPNETPCLNCILNREDKNLIYRKEKKFFESYDLDDNEIFIESIILQGISVLNLEIIKRIMFDEKIAIEQGLLNTILEFSFLDSKIEEHNVLRDPNCDICNNFENLNINSIWTSKIM
ncbi:MAG: hypothetical protein ACRC57_13460 [Sarcina sp.]